ncbi:MAG: acyl-CoA carboxylase subunit beta [Candidatus Hydrogenedentes bacterium]|nr:acyl-CoA carboxylase subunit beta [Candidatus Hydrogenedentota bacterium]
MKQPPSARTGTSQEREAPAGGLRALAEELHQQEILLEQGGGPKGQERQHKLGRLFARERIARLLDNEDSFLELGLWAGWRMYPEVGDVPAAGVVTGIGLVHNRPCMIVANDATVKAGAFFPQTVKKVLRAQRVAFENALPLLYLVDSAGVYLPMQDEIFPDEDDFGRIFRNNCVLSAGGVPQYAAIMGNCIAGGAYLPVLSDKILMTEGSGLYLAGAALVKAAIGQEVDQEDLGGAAMHAQVSGTVDFREKDDDSCLARLRELVTLLPAERWGWAGDHAEVHPPARDPEDVYSLVDAAGRKEYDMRDVIDCIVDQGSLQEYKAEYGKSLITAYARIGGHAAGIVANQRKRQESKKEGIQIGGVIYHESADKAARFVMDCNQTGIPLLFLQDVVGFMVGRDSEQSGIIRRGAKLVSAVSNSVVPKITVVIGGSFGAGNYALCGKAYDPRFIFAWPSAKYAVMGAAQASGVIFSIKQKSAETEAQQKGLTLDGDELEALRRQVHEDYEETTDIRYGAARGWVDAVIAPHLTREVVSTVLGLVKRETPQARFKTGVIQT